MQAYQIVAGFSDIKVEFLMKTRTSKSLEELRLWFSYEGEVLYVHDYITHETCMVLAAYSPSKDSWGIFLRKGSYGEKTVEFLIGSAPQAAIARTFNKRYESDGFFPFG